MATKSKTQTRVAHLAVAGLAGVLLLALGAMVFTNSRINSATLEEAGYLHAADMSLAAQDVAMKSVGQLVLVAQDFELGVAGRDAVEAAADEARSALVELESRTGALSGQASIRVGPTLSSYQEVAAAVIQLALDGEVAAATATLGGQLVPLAEQAASGITTERDERSQAVEDAHGWAGQLAQIAGLLTALLLPLGAMLAYRQSVRRQLEAAEAHLDARLDAERTVSRDKDQFIANISHELRTPLTSIYGFSEVLLEQGFVDPKIAGDLVSLINSESAELARMVEDLLVAAHDEEAPLPIEITEVDIASELDAVIAPFRRREIVVGGTYAPAVVLGDQLRIRQILRNLLSNAVQHGGPTIRIYGDEAGSRYVVSVEDDGEGVPEHVAERLFTRFVHKGETPLTAGSIGLGLAVARLLAEAMGGSLDYERITGRTSFVLALPLAAGDHDVVERDEILVPTTG
jgi:signal transduction histidine kinase